jgi:hypothetical protein
METQRGNRNAMGEHRKCEQILKLKYTEREQKAAEL